MKAGNHSYDKPDDLPGTIPIFPLPGALLLPRADMPLNIFETRYLAMIDQAERFLRDTKCERWCELLGIEYEAFLERLDNT